MSCNHPNKKSLQHKNADCAKPQVQLKSDDCQKISQKFIKRNINFRKLLGKCASPITAYVLITVKLSKEKKRFVQKGSSPNLEGELATLCCCRPDIRAWP